MITGIKKWGVLLIYIFLITTSALATDKYRESVQEDPSTGLSSTLSDHHNFRFTAYEFPNPYPQFSIA